MPADSSLYCWVKRCPRPPEPDLLLMVVGAPLGSKGTDPHSHPIKPEAAAVMFSTPVDAAVPQLTVGIINRHAALNASGEWLTVSELFSSREAADTAIASADGAQWLQGAVAKFPLEISLDPDVVPDTRGDALCVWLKQGPAPATGAEPIDGLVRAVLGLDVQDLPYAVSDASAPADRVWTSAQALLESAAMLVDGAIPPLVEAWCDGAPDDQRFLLRLALSTA